MQVLCREPISLSVLRCNNHLCQHRPLNAPSSDGFGAIMSAPLEDDCAITKSLEKAAEVSARRVLINAFSNYGYYALQALVLLVLQAYVIRSVGKAEYSLWPLCRTCISISALIQLGIGSGASRFISHALGTKDQQQIHRITSTLFVALSVGAVLYFVAFTLVGLNFQQIFDIPAGAEGIAMPTMLLLGLAGAILMPFSIFEGVLVAAQERIRLNTIRGALLLVRLCLVVLAFELDKPSIVYIAATQVILSLSEAAALYHVSGRVFPWRRLSFHDCHWATFRTINSFSLLTLVTAVAGKLYWDADQIVINKFLDPTLVAGYSVTSTLLMQSLQITRLASTAFMSPLTILYAQNRYDRIARILYRSNRIAVPVGAIALLFFTFYGDDFIRAYIGNGFEECTGLFYLLGPAMLLSQTQTLSARIPTVCGHARLPAITSVLAAVANLFLSLYFVSEYNLGLAGIAAATVIVLLAYRVLFTTWYAAYLLKIPFHTFLTNLIGIPLLLCIPSILVFSAGQFIAIERSWPYLICMVLLATAAQGIGCYRYGLLQSDRDATIRLARSIPTRTRQLLLRAATRASS